MREYEQASHWLTQNIGKPLVIKKWEKQVGGKSTAGLDKVELVLERVSIREADHVDLDSYVAPRELILHGRGQIYSEEGHFPLPQGALEIPLTGKIMTRDTSLGLEIETERGIYSIKTRGKD